MVSRAGVQSVVLLLIGGTLIRTAWTGTYVRYVKPGLHWYLIAAGAVLVAVAVVNLVRLYRPAGTDVHAGEHPGDGHGHGHAHGGFEPSWLLVAPALALLLVAPPALGSYAASHGGTALNAAPTSDFPPLPDGDPVRISMLDYAGRAVFDKGRTLAGRRVTLSGFVLADGDRRYLARMVITCCAADARPVKIGLDGAVPPDAAADTWLEVTGTYSPRTDTDPIDGEPVPYLTVTAAHPVAAPKQPYES
ncbi:TIGR03943 family putative permease subunit [Dactylosporangium sp. NPDC048998]|uniref:TIGR03943 family putative permease subunit n=1 Tax=Dactylosporangium sp. NPDC048998 TaxID=3363976 RepID=UPI003712912B